MDVLRLELERLNEMMSAIYPAAAEGDVNAIMTVLKIMERRAKLEGLDAAMKAESQTASVIGGPDQFAEALGRLRSIVARAFRAADEERSLEEAKPLSVSR